MNRNYLYVLVAISITSIAMIASTTTTMNSSSPGVVGAIVPIMGHVTLTVQDDSGMIKQYVESDNVIVNGGEDCLAKLLFGPRTGPIVDGSNVPVCDGALTNPYTWIALGTDGTAVAETDNDLGTQLLADGLEIGNGDVTWKRSTGLGTAGDSDSEVVITRAFAATAANTITGITETGLFNSTDVNTNGMFARNVFTPVSVSNGDTLTVQWTITMGS